jgi:hypothetical protein
MASQAEELQAQVAQFKLRQQERQAPSAERRVVAPKAGKVIPLKAKGERRAPGTLGVTERRAEDRGPKTGDREPKIAVAAATGTDDAQGHFEEF